MIGTDLRRKASWCYGSTGWKAILKVLLTDGTCAMILYRMMQWSRRWGLVPLEMILNKLNGIFCQCIIGRGAEFGPGFVLIHSQGVVINGSVKGGKNIYVEHQVTIGAERYQSPTLGDEIFVGPAPSFWEQSTLEMARESARTPWSLMTFHLTQPSSEYQPELCAHTCHRVQSMLTMYRRT